MRPSEARMCRWRWRIDHCHSNTARLPSLTATAISLTTSDIDACTSDASLMASLQQTEGYATAQQGIPGTPTVILNGESMSSTRLMLRQVCKAFATLNPSAKSPAGCSSSMKQLRGSVLASSSAM